MAVRSQSRLLPALVLLVVILATMDIPTLNFISSPGSKHHPATTLVGALSVAVSKTPGASPVTGDTTMARGGTTVGALALFAVVAAASCALQSEQSGRRRPGVQRHATDGVTPKEDEAEKKPFNVWEPDTYGNITMDDVKKYGVAGTISYFVTELAFWAIAIPLECFAFWETVGHWPDFMIPEESAEVFSLVFAASNIARLLLPVRFGAALAMAPWVDENVVKRFNGDKAKA